MRFGTDDPHSRKSNMRFRFPLMLVFPLLLAGCTIGDAVRDRLRSATPHERYAAGLEASGLDRSTLGRAWLRAADSALGRPLRIALPYREAGYFASTEAAAVVFRVDARRGQRLLVDVTAQGDADAPAPLLFVDLFRPVNGAAPRLVATGDSAHAALSVDIDEDGPVLLRLQPELLRTLRYDLTVRTTATLAFPVRGRNARAVESFWGASRDAGARRHEGIDIFAPRGTPAVAAAEGYVSAVQTTSLGGRVVWLWDAAHQQSLYYAHLDTQLVSPGDQVKVGDVLGLVGNTGNARTTPTHLHFGVYLRGSGAVDPFPFVDDRPRPLAQISVDTTALGGWRRVVSRASVALDGMGGGATVLHGGSLVRADAAEGLRYRVRTPDGLAGWATASSTEDARRPLHDDERLTSAAALRDRPAPAALSLGDLPAGATVAVLGRSGDFWLVRSGAREGWIDVRSDGMAIGATSSGPAKLSLHASR
jgi:murein DD-endopeptidase MepM/ murein hydrolase activator NlpD